MNSELRARLASRGPVRDESPPPSFSGARIEVVLRRVGAFDRRLSVLKRLRAAGLSLQGAHAAITRLAEAGLAVTAIAEGANIPALARDLAALGVTVARERARDGTEINTIRARHGLSQREFAALLGIDLDTLRNWEQGRNRPDAAALSLVRAFDAAPDIVANAALMPAG